MKRGIFLLFSIIFASLIFTGCDKTEKKVTLSTPTNLLVENQYITFDPVENATCYLINYDGITFNVFPTDDEEVVVDGTSIFTEARNYEIKVKALGEGKYLDSNYSTIFTYKRYDVLATPTLNLNNKTLTWTKIENAPGYTVKVNLPDGSIYTYNAGINISDITSLLNQVGTYYFQVKAGEVADDNEYSTAVSFNYTKDLDTPSQLELFYEDDELYLSFVSDENSYGYDLYVNGSEFRLYDLNLTKYSVDTGFKNLKKIKLLSFLKSQNDEYKNLNNFEVAVKAVASISSNYFNSGLSEVAEYSKKSKLDAPTLELEAYNNEVELSWSNVEGATGYALYKNYEFSLEFKNGDNSVWLNKTDMANNVYNIQAIGVGTKTSSVLSNPVSLADEQTRATSIGYNKGTISWQEVANVDFYVLEMINDNSYKRVVLEANGYNLENKVDFGDYQIYLTTYSQGKLSNVVTKDITFSKTLDKVSNAEISSVGANLYLTFDKVDMAIGYAIRLNNEIIDNLFTTNNIDITSYMLASDLDKYTVEIIALATVNQDLALADWTLVDEVSWTEKLSMPIYSIKNDLGEEIGPDSNKGEYNKYIIYIEPVKNAESYTISINHIPYFEAVAYNENGYDISNYLTSAQKYTIRVKANAGVNAKYIDSDYNPKSISKYVQLTTINSDEMKVEIEEDKYWLTFSSQTLAVSYKIRINFGENNIALTSTSNKIDITNYVQASGTYKIYVTAEALNGDNYYYISGSESTNPYILKKELASLSDVVNIKVEDREPGHSQVLASWDKVNNAEVYYINLYYTPKYRQDVKLIGEFNSNKNSFNIAPYLTLEGMYQIKVKAIANGYQSSSFVTFSYDYTMRVDSDFERNQVFIDGHNYNHLVDGYEQYEKLLWYYYLYNDFDYRDETVQKDYVMKVMFNIPIYSEESASLVSQFKEKYSLDVNYSSEDEMLYYMAFVALNNYYEGSYYIAYDENSNLDDTEALMNALKANIQITQLAHEDLSYTIFDFTSNYISDEKVELNKEQTYKKFGAYTQLLHSSETRAQNYLNYVYEIDKLEKINVTTSEQLFMAVQSGKSPNFVGESTVAQTIFNNAKKIINSIISYEMTDYEKVTAIYDWISKNVEYNYEFENMVEALKVPDYRQPVLANGPAVAQYKYHYLEGVFLDENNRSATSNGFAKAFVLLCRIEGIEAIKINGEKSVNGKYFDYYWNKVNIDLSPNDDQNLKSWTLVDISSSFIKVDFSLNSYYQLPSHNCFMISDEEYFSINNNVKYATNKNNSSYESCVAVNGNYYNNTRYSYNFVLYTRNPDTNLLEKVVYSGDGVLTQIDGSSELYVKDVMKYLASIYNKTNNCIIDIKLPDEATASLLAEQFNRYSRELLEELGQEWSWQYIVETIDNKLVIAYKNPNN